MIMPARLLTKGSVRYSCGLASWVCYRSVKALLAGGAFCRERSCCRGQDHFFVAGAVCGRGIRASRKPRRFLCLKFLSGVPREDVVGTTRLSFSLPSKNVAK